MKFRGGLQVDDTVDTGFGMIVYINSSSGGAGVYVARDGTLDFLGGSDIFSFQSNGVLRTRYRFIGSIVRIGSGRWE